MSYSTISALQDAIYDLLDPLLTRQIIWQRQDAPQPTDSYVALNLSSFAIAEGRGYERRIEGSARNLVSFRVAVLNIQAYGENAVQELFDLKSKLFLESTIEAFLAANISLRVDEDVLDISQLLDTEFQERASLDLRLGYTKEDSDGTNHVEIVTGTDPLGENYTVDGS